MASKTIEGIKKCDLWYLGGNFDSDLLQSIETADDVPKFRYRCTHSESLDLNDLRCRFTVSRYRSGRFNNETRATVQLTYGLRQSQIDDIKKMGKEVEAIVFYFKDSQNEGNKITISEQSDLIATSNWYDFTYEMPRGKNMNSPIACVIKFVGEDTPLVYERNWWLEICELKDSDPKKPDGRLIEGVPYNFDQQTGKPWNAYGWRGNISFPWSVAGLYGNREQRSILETSHVLYKSQEDAIKKVKGEEVDPMDEDGEGGDDLAEDREVTLYYESDISSRTYNSATSTHIGASNIHFRVQYKNNKGEEIVNPYRAICGYVTNNNVPNDSNRFGNIIWVANNNINLLETEQHPVSGSMVTSKTIPNYANTTGFFPPYIDDDTIYDARYRTNMRIFANEQDALDFLNGDNPTPIGESGNKFNPNGFIGDKTVFNDGHDMAGGGMSSCWIMNESQLEDLASVFTTGLTKVEEQDGDLVINITKTCARAFASHGEPIDAVVDLFWLPFDPSEFVITGASSFTLSQDDLSTATSLLKITAQSGDVVKAHGNRSFGESKEFVGNVVNTMGGMFGTTIQKVQNVGN